MSTRSSKTFDWREDLEKRRRAWAELNAPRRPMDQLPDEYRVTETNPKPPLIHFGVPIKDTVDLYKYAAKHDLIKYWQCAPKVISPASVFFAAEKLSEAVECELEVVWPFGPTADCRIVLELYSNYTMDDKMLIDEDQEDVVQLVQKELGFDKSLRPRWYFDADDPWKPHSSCRWTT